MTWANSQEKQTKVIRAVLDTFLWQGLASVAIPGFTINRLCAAVNLALTKTTRLPPAMRKWTTTFAGLAAIPFIINPIDRSVDWMMNNSVRQWYHIEKEEQEIVHHTRDD